MTDDFRFNHVHTSDVTGAIKLLEQAEDKGKQYIRTHVRRHTSDEERAAIERTAAEIVAEEVAKVRRFGLEALEELEAEGERLYSQAKRDLGPTNAEQWRKYADMRPALEARISHAKPDEIAEMYRTARGSIERAVIVELAEARLKAVMDEPGSAEDPEYRKRFASAIRTLDDLRGQHLAPLADAKADNDAALSLFKKRLKDPYGELDRKRHEAELEARFGVRHYDGDEAERAMAQHRKVVAFNDYVVEQAAKRGFVKSERTPEPAA